MNKILIGDFVIYNKNYNSGKNKADLTIGNLYKILNVKNNYKCFKIAIAIRDDKGVFRWYSFNENKETWVKILNIKSNLIYKMLQNFSVNGFIYNKDFYKLSIELNELNKIELRNFSEFICSDCSHINYSSDELVNIYLNKYK